MRKTAVAGSILASFLALLVSLTLVLADSSTPVNLVGVSFSPITTSTSFNYDFSTGVLTPGTATSTELSVSNVILTAVSDPTPPDPKGSGTFFGTARPVSSAGGAVLYEQSVCPSGYPTCFSDGSFTFGGMVMRHVRGLTLDQITNLQSMYNIQTGCFGGGSPRFQIDMSNGDNIFVYFGTFPNFNDCAPTDTWVSTGNFAADSAGFRWDTSQICPGTQYNDYSGAKACADLHGLTIDSLILVTDGGWSGANAGNSDGQTFLFEEIQVNSTTRFP
jgi:hypothetical protein